MADSRTATDLSMEENRAQSRTEAELNTEEMMVTLGF